MDERRINNANQKTEVATLWPYGKCRRCVNKNYCIWNKDEIINCISNDYPNFREMTNADRIRNMTDEELAEILHSLKNKCGDCPVAKSSIFCSTFPTCKDAWLAWLRQEGEI